MANNVLTMLSEHDQDAELLTENLRLKLELQLASLGDEAEAIAEALATAGVRGARRSPSDHPLARYLTIALGPDCSVLVSLDAVVAATPRVAVRVPASYPVACFIAQFDDMGDFSELDAAVDVVAVDV